MTEANFGDTPVYFNSRGIANVLSLYRLGRKFRVTYDSTHRNGVFQVHTKHSVVEFKPTPKGFHALSLKDNPDAAFLLVNDAEVQMPHVTPTEPNVTTVWTNFEGFSCKQVEGAMSARRLMGMVATPSPRDFEGMVRLNMLKDCPVTNEDIKNANKIFGTDLATIRGKTVRRRPKQVITDYVNISRLLVDTNQQVTLAADVMFVNSVPFLVSVSQNINLITIEHTPSTRAASSLGSLLQRIIRVYARAGFTVQSILMDIEFDKVRNHVPMLDVNTTAASEHVEDIERHIRLIKERAQCIICTLPYSRLPRIMLIHLLHFITMWLNNFPVSNGVSVNFSPREIILRHRLSYKYHCRAPFGAYCETHEDNEPTNTMQSRALSTICLGPTGNFQGSYHFLNLLTGLVIKRRAFFELPAPQSVIDRVNTLALKSGVPRELIFANRNCIPFSWSTTNDNSTADAAPAPAAPYPDLPAEMPGMLLQRHLRPSPAGVTTSQDQQILLAN